VVLEWWLRWVHEAKEASNIIALFGHVHLSKINESNNREDKNTSI
jgi:hypothetical protein